MKVKFNIRDYKDIQIIPEISYSDLMDGTPDSMSFSFIYDKDFTKLVQLKDKCTVILEDNNFQIIRTEYYIDFENNQLIADKIYNIVGEYLYYNDKVVGVLNNLNKIVILNNAEYIYYDTIDDKTYLYIDNRKYYYMVLSQVNSEKMSTFANNGYMVTVSLKEQTILLKDCVRSDLTITPSSYPLIAGKEMLFPTLLEATWKICDRHNLHLLNEKIISLDEELSEALSEVSCPNLTYKDLSTYDQLYDIFMRIGRVPYFENGTLYGLLLTGKNKTLTNKFYFYTDVLENYNGLTIYNDKNKITITGTYTSTGTSLATNFTNIIPSGRYWYKVNRKDIQFDFYNYSPRYTVSSNTLKNEGEIVFSEQVEGISIYLSPNKVYDDTIILELYDYDEYQKNAKKELTTYSSYSTTKIEGVNQNVFTTKVYNNLYDDETMVVPSIFSDSLEIIDYEASAGKLSDISDVGVWVDDEFDKWTRLSSISDVDTRRLLGINNFNNSASTIEDPRSYYIQLPSNIETITRIYKCIPYVRVDENSQYIRFGFRKIPIGYKLYKVNDDADEYVSDITNITFSLNNVTYTFELYPDNNGNGGYLSVRYNNVPFGVGISNYEFTDIVTGQKYSIKYLPNLVEYQAWSQLSKLEQGKTSYYTRGDSKISQIISMIAPEIYLTDSFSWSDSVLYDRLKENFFIVEYKPCTTTEYINYDYSKLDDAYKPQDVSTYNLPYKTITDRQVYPLLEYNLDKGLDTNSQFKVVTKDTSILKLTASDKVYIFGKPYIINSMVSSINDKSVEVTFELSQRATINSIISSYQDSVRVSTNLSEEQTVIANFPILSEEVVYLSTTPTSSTSLLDIMTSDNSYFTQEVGKNLISGAYHVLNMYSNYNAVRFQKYMTKFPLRFDTLVQKKVEHITIRLNSNFPYSQTDFEIESFPIYARKTIKNIPGLRNDSSINYYDTTTINSLLELKEFVTSHNMYAKFPKIFGSFIYWLPDSFAWCEFSLDGSTWVQMRPEMWYGEASGRTTGLFEDYYGSSEGWSVVSTRDTNYSSTYNPYTILNQYENEYVYCTEGMLSDTGKLTSYNYLLNDPVATLTRYSTNALNSEDIKNAVSNPGTLKILSPNIISTDPILYNSTKHGCILAGFGSDISKEYSFAILNNYFGKATIIDIREIPSPYIQFKTIHRPSDDFEIINLSNDIPWLKPITESGLPSVYSYDKYLIKVPDDINIDDLNITADNYKNYLVEGVNLQQNYNGWLLQGSSSIYANENYGIIGINTITDDMVRILSFKPKRTINSGEGIYINLEIRNSYDSIPHYKVVKQFEEDYSNVFGTTIVELDLEGVTLNANDKINITFELQGYGSITGEYNISIGSANAPVITLKFGTVLTFVKIYYENEKIIIKSVDEPSSDILTAKGIYITKEV
jgi:uncharacterized protein YcgL (UPF0745 family)